QKAKSWANGFTHEKSSGKGGTSTDDCGFGTSNSLRRSSMFSKRSAVVIASRLSEPLPMRSFNPSSHIVSTRSENVAPLIESPLCRTIRMHRINCAPLFRPVTSSPRSTDAISLAATLRTFPACDTPSTYGSASVSVRHNTSDASNFQKQYWSSPL
ncbi:unnamed protein product, partial [Haemonchus placei]|uniref:DUF1908 domain-containing protein n=1 Tax=Haemonchus placei TaxID=6290 RepID=A0A0N4X0X9_HAEPC